MKKVLNVGQCGMDHGAISGLIEAAFGASVFAAHTAEQAMEQLRGQPFDLVLVNRVLDADGSDGLEIVRAIKADPALAAMPVMLVTNYAEYQQRAVEAGAEEGFGKAQYSAPSTRERLRKFLA